MRTSARGSWIAVVAAALLLAAAGCVSSAQREISADLPAQLAQRGLTPSEVVLPQKLGEAARGWLRQREPALTAAGQRGARSDPNAARGVLQALLDALAAEDGLAIVYDPAYTGTADEVFASRRANCLGFMNLFIGMARELEIPAYYLAVDEVTSFGREGDLVLVSDHVAAGFGRRDGMLILDFASGQEPVWEAVRPLSDLEALARYYSNRGVEQLRAGRSDEALAWLERSVVLEPELAASWANLGVVRRRGGDLDGAEAAYRMALEIDPASMSAYHNYAALLRLRGQVERARRLLALTDRLDNRNPYNFLNLGDWSLEEGDVAGARRFFRRALRLAPEAAEPYAALGELEAATGHPARARRWLRKASQRDPEQERVRHLAEMLAEPS